MKNTDYNLGKDYEVVVMSSKDLKRKLMKDNSLTEEDIFLHYSLSNWSKIQIELESLKGDIYKTAKYPYLTSNLLTSYIVSKKNLLLSRTVEYVERLKTIEELCIELEIDKVPYLDEDGLHYKNFISEFQSKFMFHTDMVYDKCDLSIAIDETFEYNMKLYNENRNIETEKFKQCIENSYVVINEREDGRYELIDGFYRILYKNIDKNVIVKVYKNITDEEWFKLMINCNYWKTNVSRSLFYDRGFMLGLRCRYGIYMEDYITQDTHKDSYNGLVELLSDYIEPLYINHNREFKIIMTEKGLDINNDLLRRYNADDFRNQLLVNKFFVSDLKMIKNYLSYLPENLLKSKKLEGVNIFKNYAYNKFLSNIIKLIFTYRIHFSNNDMNELPMDLIDKIFEDKEIQTSFIKAVGMSVSGFVDNRLELLYPNLISLFNEIILNNK